MSKSRAAAAAAAAAKRENDIPRGYLLHACFPVRTASYLAAQTSGIITPGDRILKINGESVCDMPFKQAREILRVLEDPAP